MAKRNKPDCAGLGGRCSVVSLPLQCGVPNVLPLSRLPWFDDALFERVAKSFEDPDWADVTLHSYRVRLGRGRARFTLWRARAQAVEAEVISVPMLTLHGDDDRVILRPVVNVNSCRVSVIFRPGSAGAGSCLPLAGNIQGQLVASGASGGWRAFWLPARLQIAAPGRCHEVLFRGRVIPAAGCPQRCRSA